MIKKYIILGVLSLTILCNTGFASEVKKGGIPKEHLKKSLSQLPWKVGIWGVDEVITAIKKKEPVIFIDTRPESFLAEGSVKGAFCLPYNIKGTKNNILTEASLLAAIKKSGYKKGTAKIAFFCQGPKCHRSYNATYIAVKEWGFTPEEIIWFRDGYPLMLKKIKETARLKRKARKYLSKEGLTQLSK